MGRLRGLIVIVMLLLVGARVHAQPSGNESPQSKISQAGVDWFNEARFGMFIHWNASSMRATQWLSYWNQWSLPGSLDPYNGEPGWYMARTPIPLVKYQQIPQSFNPTQFNAEQWVLLAKNAGMKYIVLTAKHHDGFAMYDSAASSYNVVDMTPFARDVVREFADACARQGIKFCIYYSHYQDWQDPNADGNTWDFNAATKNFDTYFNAKCVSQVRELMSSYGPIGLVWFDTPGRISLANSQTLVNLVHSLQPDCLVNSRVGNYVHDYYSMYDSTSPLVELEYPWDTPCKIASSWFYRDGTQSTRSAQEIIRWVAYNASKGGNLLMNVAPRYDGTPIPGDAAALQQVGQWMSANGEAIYDTTFNPFRCLFPWGVVTARPGKLYLHVHHWPTDGRLTIYGLRSRVTGAQLLTSGTPLGFAQSHAEGLDLDVLMLDIPRQMPDSKATVIALDIEGATTVNTAIHQQPEGTIMMEVLRAQQHLAASGSHYTLLPHGRGWAWKWLNAGDWLSWDIKVVTPGRYRIKVYTCVWGGDWDGGHRVKIRIGSNELTSTIQNNGTVNDDDDLYDGFVVSNQGELEIPAAGTVHAELKPELITATNGMGFTFRAIRLEPIELYTGVEGYEVYR